MFEVSSDQALGSARQSNFQECFIIRIRKTSRQGFARHHNTTRLYLTQQGLDVSIGKRKLGSAENLGVLRENSGVEA